MKDVEQEIIGTALPYWETEAAIVRRFFKSKPARDDHIFCVKAQLCKELHLVDGYFTGLQKELNNLVTSFPEMIKASGSTGILTARTTHSGVQSLCLDG